MANQLIKDSALLYSILSRVEPSLVSGESETSLRSSAIARTIIELYPTTLFSSGIQLSPKRGNNGEGIDRWIDWESTHDFYALCTEAAIEARWVGDSFLILDDGGDWESPLRSPPDSVYRISYLYPADKPFMTIGSDKIHITKVIHFSGNKNLIPNYSHADGWRNQFTNLPVISDCLEKNIKLLELAPDALFTALRTASQFILGQEGLANMLYADQVAGTNTVEQKIATRASTLNRSRDNGSVILYDSDSEELGSVTSSTANLDALYECLKDAVACQSGIPAKELFDTGSVGMVSGLQNQLVTRFETATKAKQWGDYNVRSKLKSLISVFGDFSFEFPLKVALNSGETVDYEKQLADRNKVLIDSGVVTPDEVRKSYLEASETTPVHLNLVSPDVETENTKVENNMNENSTLKTDEALDEIDPEFLEIDWESFIYVDALATIEVSEAALESSLNSESKN